MYLVGLLAKSIFVWQNICTSKTKKRSKYRLICTRSCRSFRGYSREYFVLRLKNKGILHVEVFGKPASRWKTKIGTQQFEVKKIYLNAWARETGFNFRPHKDGICQIKTLKNEILRWKNDEIYDVMRKKFSPLPGLEPVTFSFKSIISSFISSEISSHFCLFLR